MLADFLEDRSTHGELARVGAEVDVDLEIAEITRRITRSGDAPILLFDRVRGHAGAVVANVLGTEQRVCRALDLESLSEIPQRLEALIRHHTPQNWFDRLKMAGDTSGTDKFRPKTIKTGAAQQVVRLGRDIDLATLPLIRQWPAETSPAITAGLLISRSLGSEETSLTPCTLPSVDAQTLAVLEEGHSAWHTQWQAYRAAGEKMPLAIILGGPLALNIASELSWAGAFDAFLLAGLLQGKALETVKCRTHDLQAPAEADWIFEGYLDPTEAPLERSRPDQLGHYWLPPRCAPPLHLTAVTQRSHPLFPTIVAGDGHARTMTKLRERTLLPALRGLAADIVDLHLPACSGPQQFAVASFHKHYPHQARQIASSLWGTAPLRFAKFLVLVDAEVNVHDPAAVRAAIEAHVVPRRDLIRFDGPAHVADFHATQSWLSEHLGLDATAKIAGEQQSPVPRGLQAATEIVERVTARWGEYGLPPGNVG